jgi:potassium voltage-gated channel Eag-related subfamily H member 2
MYTAIFTPYVAAFLLDDQEYKEGKNRKYGDDPIVIIDLIGELNILQNNNVLNVSCTNQKH